MSNCRCRTGLYGVAGRLSRVGRGLRILKGELQAVIGLRDTATPPHDAHEAHDAPSTRSAARPPAAGFDA